MDNIKKPKKGKMDLSSIKAKDTNTKRMMFVGASMLILLVMFGYSQFVSMKRISVIKLKESVIAGDVVDVATSFKKHDMLYSAYLEEGRMKVKQEDGTLKEEQGYILWKDRNKYQDWYFNTYQGEDTNFTINSASEEMQYKNPLIEGMPIGNEEYVLDIDSNGINMHQLFPGTTLRMRVAFEVPLSLQEECRVAVSNKSKYDGSSVVLDILNKYGYQTSAQGSTGDIIEGEGFSGVETNADDTRTAYVSEVIFNEIQAVDMQSTSGESIFEVYMSLLKMPLEERIPYLQTSFSDDKSGEFRSRITPKSLVLSLKKDESNKLHEFEAMNYQTKWTIVKTATSSDMLKDFVQINEEIYNTGK